MQVPVKSRLDELLVKRGFFASRSRARDAIERATVSVAGRTATKAGAMVAQDAEVKVDDAASRYVARSALKLVAGLDHFGFDATDTIALDIGASTGGFTQVLLERGAARVHAIDVGHDQMHPSVAQDRRVRLREGLNARDLTPADLHGDAPDMIVCDVSFITLKLALPPALDLTAPGARGVFLVKPQFEAGRDAIGKGGLLKDPAEGPRIAAALGEWLAAQPGWRMLGVTASPISGGDGNHEYLLGGVKDR